MPHGNESLMHRVRIGITGLAVVFLIVLLAAAIVGFHTKDQAGMGNSVAGIGNSGEAQPADPLAELGVAPGGTASTTDSDTTTDAPGR